MRPRLGVCARARGLRPAGHIHILDCACEGRRISWSNGQRGSLRGGSIDVRIGSGVRFGTGRERNGESRLLVELVQDVRLVDTSRAWILAERWRQYSIALHAPDAHGNLTDEFCLAGAPTFGAQVM